MLSILLPLLSGPQAYAQTTPPLPLLEAQAGVDFMAYVGQTVELAGGGSGAEELSYSWVRSGGPPAELSDPTSDSPQFTPEQPGSYRWDLSVSSGAEASLPDTVTVMVIATDTPKMEGGCSSTGSSPLWGLGALGLALAFCRRSSSAKP